jgi:glucose-1-phosphate adenylyltransferase
MPALVDDTIVIVLAGRRRAALPLTKDTAPSPRCSLAVPIALSISRSATASLWPASHLHRDAIQKSLSLNRHIRMGWSIVSEELGEFVTEILPPQNA